MNIEEVESSSDEESETGKAVESALTQEAKLTDKCEARNVLGEADTIAKHATCSKAKSNLTVNKENISSNRKSTNDISISISCQKSVAKSVCEVKTVSGSQGKDISSSNMKRSAETQCDRMTPYEFLHAWTSLKKSDLDNDYLNLLLQIEPARLSKGMISSVRNALPYQ